MAASFPQLLIKLHRMKDNISKRKLLMKLSFEYEKQWGLCAYPYTIIVKKD